MVDITYQMVLSTIQTVSLVVGITYYIMTIRANKRNQEISLKNQQLSSVHRILDVYRDPEEYYKWLEVLHLEWDDPDDFWEKYGATKNPEIATKYGTMFQYYDGIGYLWKEGVIDIKSLSVYLGWGCLILWKRYKPIVESYRKWYLDAFLYWEQLTEALEELIGDRITSP